MDIIRRYTPDVRDYESKEIACKELIEQFLENFSLIAAECESQFVLRFFMSSILAFCAEIDLADDQLFERLVRLFIDHQNGVWDIWSISRFDRRQWTILHNCLNVEFSDSSSESETHVLEYIIRYANKLQISFADPLNSEAVIRFVDYPRYSAIQSNSDLWRSLHLPIISCTLLPENLSVLRILLQYGAEIPTDDYILSHILSRIRHLIALSSFETLVKKLLWIKLLLTDLSCGTSLYGKLISAAEEMMHSIDCNYEKISHFIVESFDAIPTLQHQSRLVIRRQLRLSWQLPLGINFLPVNSRMKDYLNLYYL